MKGHDDYGLELVFLEDPDHPKDVTSDDEISIGSGESGYGDMPELVPRKTMDSDDSSEVNHYTSSIPTISEATKEVTHVVDHTGPRYSQGLKLLLNHLKKQRHTSPMTNAVD